MSLRLRVANDAESELGAAAAWYESKRAGLGVEFVAEIDSAFDQLLDPHRRLDSPQDTTRRVRSSSRTGLHSIRVNDQWRFVFRWADDGVHDLRLTDYH